MRKLLSRFLSGIGALCGIGRERVSDFVQRVESDPDEVVRGQPLEPGVAPAAPKAKVSYPLPNGDEGDGYGPRPYGEEDQT